MSLDQCPLTGKALKQVGSKGHLSTVGFTRSSSEAGPRILSFVSIFGYITLSLTVGFLCLGEVILPFPQEMLDLSGEEKRMRMTFFQGGGSALMRRQGCLEQMVRGMKQVLSRPLTLKMRTAVYRDTKVAHDLVQRAKLWDVSMVTIHGRSKEQRYLKLADWDYVGQCAVAAQPMPVFGNGDVLSYEDYNACLNNTGVAGIMIARGALIKPWVFQEIKEQRHWDISSSERLDMLRDFTNFGLEHWGSDNEDTNKNLVRSPSLHPHHHKEVELFNKILSCWCPAGLTSSEILVLSKSLSKILLETSFTTIIPDHFSCIAAFVVVLGAAVNSPAMPKGTLAKSSIATVPTISATAAGLTTEKKFDQQLSATNKDESDTTNERLPVSGEKEPRRTVVTETRLEKFPVKKPKESTVGPTLNLPSNKTIKEIVVERKTVKDTQGPQQKISNASQIEKKVKAVKPTHEIPEQKDKKQKVDEKYKDLQDKIKITKVSKQKAEETTKAEKKEPCLKEIKLNKTIIEAAAVKSGEDKMKAAPVLEKVVKEVPEIKSKKKIVDKATKKRMLVVKANEIADGKSVKRKRRNGNERQNDYREEETETDDLSKKELERRDKEKERKRRMREKMGRKHSKSGKSEEAREEEKEQKRMEKLEEKKEKKKEEKEMEREQLVRKVLKNLEKKDKEKKEKKESEIKGLARKLAEKEKEKGSNKGDKGKQRDEKKVDTKGGNETKVEDKGKNKLQNETKKEEKAETEKIGEGEDKGIKAEKVEEKKENIAQKQEQNETKIEEGQKGKQEAEKKEDKKDVKKNGKKEKEEQDKVEKKNEETQNVNAGTKEEQVKMEGKKEGEESKEQSKNEEEKKEEEKKGEKELKKNTKEEKEDKKEKQEKKEAEEKMDNKESVEEKKGREKL
ncbi:tRNA-dihydrouridine(47) synthase [NAD(P)(+)]-like [Portunus trituberculatus]|uniref:tRNA-dihydrouridine(47) synthase [NAD(P)(+)] n=1 Tax=Portunus trituberculatus TaxID=210409 RepID=A0A5B7DUH5_PORTR|nr:tRNA-dihydrouridine(47) synthase [NAD(P)(+)]-like [Portunus trituberculatus]